MAGKFLLTRSGEQLMFVLFAPGNSEVILTSEPHMRKASALAAIAAVRFNAPLDAQYDRWNSAAGQPYFVLRARNDEVLGMSQMYRSVEAREEGIAAVMVSAPGAKLDDRT